MGWKFQKIQSFVKRIWGNIRLFQFPLKESMLLLMRMHLILQFYPFFLASSQIRFCSHGILTTRIGYCFRIDNPHRISLKCYYLQPGFPQHAFHVHYHHTMSFFDLQSPKIPRRGFSNLDTHRVPCLKLQHRFRLPVHSLPEFLDTSIQ